MTTDPPRAGVPASRADCSWPRHSSWSPAPPPRGRLPPQWVRESSPATLQRRASSTQPPRPPTSKRPLLRDADRGHPRLPGPGLGGHVAAHHLDLAVALGELHDRDLVVVRESPHAAAEGGADLLHDRRRGDPVAQVPSHERHDLPPDLEVGHVPVEIDTIQTLHIERHMPIEEIVHRHRCSHSDQRDRTRSTRPAPDSAVRGRASLGTRARNPG